MSSFYLFQFPGHSNVIRSQQQVPTAQLFCASFVKDTLCGAYPGLELGQRDPGDRTQKDEALQA